MQEFIAGILIGVFGFAGILATAPSYHKKATEALEICEASLPRDRHCIIIAIPATKE